MKRLVYSGVRKIDRGFDINYTYNYPNDIIDIVEPQLYETIHNNNVYHFGYRFNDDVDSNDRTKFIHAIKQIGDTKLTDDQLDQFIKRPLKYLNDKINLYKIDCMVYPLSNRSPLVAKIVRAINDMTSHEMHRCSFEFVKTAPVNIGFDFESFEADNSDKAGYNQMIEYINDSLLPKLHSLDYFSIAQNVKSKYRPYITGFIDFKDQESADRFSKLQGDNILLVDDINTTGSTIHEILRKLGKINNNCNIYVFTLIGK